MEALLPTIIAIILAETGSRMQRQTAALSEHFRGSVLILFALFTTSLISLLVAGFAGIWVAETLNYRARTLLLGLAFLFAAAGVAWPKKDPKPMAGGQPFLTSLWRNAVAQFGDNSQFLVFAFAARGNAPLIAAWSGIAGVMIAALPAFLYPEDWKLMFHLKSLRWIVAGVLALAGAGFALSALQII
jgi:Ca2+/H+ antiporter, TMEM165/GDT1 family